MISDDPLSTFFEEVFDKEEEKLLISLVKNKDLLSEEEQEETLTKLIDLFKKK